MRNLLDSLCKAFWGAFLLFSSIYLLLAYLPYTYVALVKAPPYGWVLWFVAHYAPLYWAALLAGIIVYRPRWKNTAQLLFLCAQGGLGFFLPRFMGNLQCDGRAYLWSIVLLLLLIGFTASDALKEHTTTSPETVGSPVFLDYSTGLFAAAAVTLLATGGEILGYHAESSGTHLARVELAGWSIISHVLVAIVVLSVLSLISLAAFRTRHSRVVRRALVGSLFAGGLWFGLVRFLQNSLSFHGWPAQLYAGSLAVALTMLGFSVGAPYLAGLRPRSEDLSWRRKFALIAIVCALAIAALAFPSLIGGADWNGFLQSTVALSVWLGLSVCAYRLRPPQAKYTLTTILAVLVLSGVAYKSLQTTEIFWGKALGATDDDVARSLETYASQDASFELAHHLLGNTRQSDCGDLCRIVRQYTNIRDAQVRTEINLVDSLKPTSSDRPNIFIFVIDSLRPDYLGAYNPKVDFSPNIDAFARDSIVVHNVFTQYAGTSLSEPAIWSGMLLLHAHYMQPFPRVNSLEKLATVDGYQMIVSWDEVLSQLLSPSDNLIKLDTDKHLWNELEVCSTIQQAEHVVDGASNHAQPVFFYTQPKNVHQFARNNLPGMRATNWRSRPGFTDRIAYEVHQVDECMGGFFAYLKRKNLYDNSIILLTSDHGDATGEFGRSSHSLSIYPEVMRVPLLIHLPEKMRGSLVYDDRRVSTLTDIAPTLYYLLGHRPLIANPMFGHPLLMENHEDLERYHRDELFLASDERAVYGILADNGRYLYATYDSPPKSYLYDLASDPLGVHDVLTPALKKEYDERIIQHLQAIGDFYGYKPKLSTLLASSGN